MGARPFAKAAPTWFKLRRTTSAGVTAAIPRIPLSARLNAQRKSARKSLGRETSDQFGLFGAMRHRGQIPAAVISSPAAQIRSGI